MKHVNRSQRIVEAVAEIILQHRQIGEYELMTELDSKYGVLYPKPDLSQSILLFQHHFYLRHCLYALQAQWLASEIGYLDIQLTKIQLLPIGESQQAVGAYDALRAYYADLSNMNKEDNASVEALLEGFWQQYTAHVAAPRAYQVLQLTGNETHAEKKRRYKQLAQQHHPDKGGDAATFAMIQEAWQCVRREM